MRSLLSLVLFVSVLGSCAGVAQRPDTPKRPPNIVLIFMDDMGYADIGSFGATAYKTPHLDEMARQGRRFTDFYVTQAVCSASRAGLMTGCYNVRVGIFGALGPRAKTGIHRDEVTIAEICKQKGYATACYGKWHLGHHKQFLPMQHGFDDYFGLPYSNDMWPYHPGVMHLPMEKRLKRWPHLPLIAKNEVINAEVSGKDQEQLTTQYTEHAVEFIEKNKDRPFFLYLPHSMVHVPLYVSEKFKGKSGAGLFGDVMMEVDWSCGQILKTLRKHGLADNTLVIFTSDNGPWLSYGDHAGSAGPLREGKGTMFDGGCRESTLMWWPGRVPAGSVCRTPAMTIDILPTIAHLIGADLPDHKIDGKNIWPLIAGVKGAKSPQEAYYFYYGRQLQALRSGKWKMHFPHGYRTMDGRPGGTGGKPNGYRQKKIGLALFDLEADVGETKDVKDAHPEVVARLQALGESMREELGDQGRRGKGFRAAGARSGNEPVEEPPIPPLARNRRGATLLKAGRFDAAIADFDAYIASEPQAESHHWQRGIAYYYAGRYRDGVRQFELHKKVNPNDVENAVWHFLCKAKLVGVAAARKSVLPVGPDARIPMMTVYDLFAGRATPAQVEDKAKATRGRQAGSALFYCHLYLGLYQEAIGKPKAARHHITVAAEKHTSPGYMGDIARMHAALMQR